MKRVLSFFLAAAMLLTLFTVPALADAESVIESIGAANGHGAYWLYDFTREGKAQQLIGSPSIYECMTESELSAQTDGLKITSDSVANNGVAFYDMPAGELYAKITYKFDSAALTEYAADDLTGSASFVVDGETVVDFAALSAAKGSKEVKAASLDGAQISNGAFATSVVKLSVTSGGSVLLSPTYLGDKTVKSEFTVARIALFANLADAEAFDTSASAVTVEGVTAEFDPFTHTAEVELAQDKTEADMMFAPTAYTFDLTTFGEEVNALSDSAEVTETNDALVSSMEFELTGTDGKVVTYTVNAVSKFSGNAMPENILDFSAEGSAKAAIDNGTVAFSSQWDNPVLGERNVGYGGTGLEMNTVDSSNKNYAQAAFKFENADVSKTYYAKMAYMFSNVSWPSGRTGEGKFFVCWRNKGDRVWSDSIVWTADSLPDDYVWATTVIKVNPSDNSDDIANKQLQLCFNGLTCKVVIKYVALFTSLDDANNFDPSVMSAKVDGKRAKVDPYKHTVTVDMANDIGVEDIPDFTADDVELALYNSTDYPQQGGSLTAQNNGKDVLALTTATAQSTDAAAGVEPGYNYKEIKYTVSGTGMSDVVWSVRIQSKDSNYVPPVEPIQLIDFTNPANISLLEDPDKGSGKWRQTGTTKVGNTNAAYFGSSVTEDRVTNDGNNGTCVLDNWHYIRYNTNKITNGTKVYVKIAYRFGEDAKAAPNNQSKRFYIDCSGRQFIGEYGADNVLSLRNGWRTVVLECTPTNSELQIGTWGILGKIMLKYVAFFESAEDAANWTYGTPDATITSDGANVTAAFDNLEGTNQTRLFAFYKDGALVKIARSADCDEITVFDLEPGTYTAKAMYWNNSLKPAMKSVEETITIQ